MKAYYFSTHDKRLRYGDGRRIKTGTTHKVAGPLELCAHGLHASKRIVDALADAPGPYLWLVELSGEIIEGDDKIVATERTYLAGFDATKTLRLFARKQALINIEKIKPYCSPDDYDLIVDWLNTGNESLRSAAEVAAKHTAWAAEASARASVWAAARYAAISAAFSAEAAARAAVWAAAETSTRTAEASAWSVAQFVARSARFAARFAAESAAESAAEDMLSSMLPARMRL